MQARRIAGVAILLVTFGALGTAAASTPGGPNLTIPEVGARNAIVLVHHALDQGVDPFWVAFGGGDTFSARYRNVQEQTGRFDYPVLVADGVTVVQQLPDPARPFEGTLAAYTAALTERRDHDAPIALQIAASFQSNAITVQVAARPDQPFDTLGQGLHLFVAVVEDAIHYQPPAPVSNGVTDHRFTVRALLDAGSVPTMAWNRTVAVPLGTWAHDQLSAVAFVQAGPVAGRFAAREILNAITSPVDGLHRGQTERAVLLEVYSATWCKECLYGDLAIERLAIQQGAAEPLEPASSGYWQAPAQPIVVYGGVVLSALSALLVLRRRR